MKDRWNGKFVVICMFIGSGILEGEEREKKEELCQTFDLTDFFKTVIV